MCAFLVNARKCVQTYSKFAMDIIYHTITWRKVQSDCTKIKSDTQNVQAWHGTGIEMGRCCTKMKSITNGTQKDKLKDTIIIVVSSLNELQV